MKCKVIEKDAEAGRSAFDLVQGQIGFTEKGDPILRVDDGIVFLRHAMFIDNSDCNGWPDKIVRVLLPGDKIELELEVE